MYGCVCVLLMYTSYNSHGRVLLIDDRVKEVFFSFFSLSAEREERRMERGAPAVTSDLWECQQVGQARENTAAGSALN